MWNEEASRFIESCIDAWMQDPDMKGLAGILKKDKKHLVDKVSDILKQKGIGTSRKYDQARSFLYRQMPASADFHLKVEHFVLFKKHRVVELILESSFGLESGVGRDSGRVVFPCQEKVIKVIARCLFPLRDRDIVTFLGLFSDLRDKVRIDQEKSMRYRSMIWFVYLLVDIISVDGGNACHKGASYFKTKLGELLDKTLEGEITAPEGKPDGYAYEGGIWKDTLFAWMQGEDSRPLVVGLIRQFNLVNKVEHGNRLLLAKHRECMYKSTRAAFCA